MGVKLLIGITNCQRVHCFLFIVNLLWTPYRHANVPPPMCAQTITTLDPILLVTFGPPSNSNDFIMLSSKGTVSFIQSANDMECVATKNGFRPVTTPLLLKSSTRYSDYNINYFLLLLLITLVC